MISRILTRWLLLIGCFFLTSAAFGQTITLSAPPSGGNAIDSAATVFSISGETGTINTVGLSIPT